MNKLIRMTSLAATVAAATVTATPAFAADPDRNANATARIVRPLVLTWEQDFNLGTIVLSGTAPYTTTVGIDQLGALTCDTTVVTCSGTRTVARYNVAGTNNQDVDITAPDVTLSDGAGNDLVLDVDAPATVTLDNSGAPGTDFTIGGSISVSDTTPDGVYSGEFDVTAEYQ